MKAKNHLVGLILTAGLLIGTQAWAEVAAINEQTPWRVWTVQGSGDVRRDNGVLTLFSGHSRKPFNPFTNDTWRASWYGVAQHPATNWFEVNADEANWPRYYMGEIRGWIGQYGAEGAEGPRRVWAVLARTRFGIDHPDHVKDLVLTAEYIGGLIVYVNGREVGRSHMPAGQSGIMAFSDEYPIEAYTLEDGTPLPPYRASDKRLQVEEIQKRYRTRVRHARINIPSEVLVKGGNLLAIEIRQAPVAGPMAVRGWSHAGLRDVKLVSATGAGVIAYTVPLERTRVWSAEKEEYVAGQWPDPVAWASKGWVSKGDGAATNVWEAFSHRSYVSPRAAPVVGVLAGNPFDPVRPIRILAPRNGVGVGQTVVTNPAGLKDVKAVVSALQGDGGAMLPAAAIEVLYGIAFEHSHYLETMSPTPPRDAATVPVWLRIRVPQSQAPGWYHGRLSVSANGTTFEVPVQTMVTGFVVPSPRESKLDIGFIQSWDSVATRYGVTLWSAEHFALMEPGLALMGELGQDVLIAPTHLTRHVRPWKEPLIRFVKDGDKLKPDFSVFEKYLDLHLKHCGPPKAVSVEVWAPGTRNRQAYANNGSYISSRESRLFDAPRVRVINPATGEQSEDVMPDYEAPGAEAFYKALVNGVRDRVVKRGMSERVVVLGIGGDSRASKEDGDLFRKWTPYARWHLLSHFNGDPGPGAFWYKPEGPDDPKVTCIAEGRYIAIGDLEIGLREDHMGTGWKETKVLEKEMLVPWQFPWLGTMRLNVSDMSVPVLYQALAVNNLGGWGRIGLDFWDQSRNPTVSNLDYFTQLCVLTAPGPKGSWPTVRFEMIRQGLQTAEARREIAMASARASTDETKARYRAILDSMRSRLFEVMIPNAEAAYDWPGYVADLFAVAGELTGTPDKASWRDPAKSK